MRGAALPDRISIDWPIAWAGVELIARAEGCRLIAYRCPAGVWTIGWGYTDGVKAGMRWTQQQADEALRHDLAARRIQVEAVCKEPAGEHELAAMCSLHYNIGKAAFEKSSVLRLHNAGQSQAAARAFALWNKARVRGVLTVLPGLTARRAAEAAVYLAPDDGAPAARMPQAVEPESSLAASPIAQSGGAVVAVGGVSALDQVAQAGSGLDVVSGVLGKLRGLIVDTLGISPDAVLPLALLAAGGAVVYWRWRQRRDGWC